MEKKFYKRNAGMSLRRMAMLLCAIFSVFLAKAEGKQASAQPERLDSYLKKIELAYKVSFVYDADEINKGMILSVPAKLTTITESLDQLKQKNIGYKLVGNQVILKVLEPVKSSTNKDIVVKGRVKDKKDGSTMPGVSIREKGTSNAVSTNAQGDYQITVKEGATLIVSSIGYKTQEIAVSGRTSIDVTIVEDASQLKEVNVVSTGYQNLNPKLFTGAATSLKGSDVKQDGITDVSRMLEGRVAGVSVQNVSGTFGAAPKIRVRGATSITGENKPLWVIDGVILEDVVNVSNEQLSSGDATTLIGSSVAGLNADDIESFNILKDASATAQYGARAMNGVIVITTKKGRIGKPVVNYTGNFSVSMKPTYDNFNIMNSADQMSVYGELDRKEWFNLGVVSRASDGGVYTKMYELIYKYDPTTGFGLSNTTDAKSAFLKRYALANTNWFDLLFKNSLQQEHSVSISSGTDKNTIYFSTSYLNDNGWALGNNVERYTTNLNTTFKLSDKFSLNLITTGSIRNQKAPGTVGRTSNPVEGKYSRDFDINPYSYATNTSRTTTAYNEDGSLEYFTRNFAPFNILRELDNNSIELSLLDFKLQGGVDYKITPKLTFKSLGSMRYVKSNQEHKIKENSNMALAYRAGTSWGGEDDSYIRDNNKFLYRDPAHPETQAVSVLPYGGFYNTTDDFLKSYLVRNSLEYQNTLGTDHELNIFVAQEMRMANRQYRNNIGYGYQYDKGGVPYVDPNAIKQAVSNNLYYYGMGNKYDRFLNFLARAAYSYKGRYAINATGRYDGSNQLGDSKNARWLPTWNISGAWYLDKENFMENTAVTKVMDRITVRGTYGLVASLGSATNSSLVVRNGSALRPYPYEIESVLRIESTKNGELTWEKQYETNVGLDVGFLKEKLTLTVDLYQRKGFDLISPLKTTGISGQYVKNANYADMKSKGIEATIGSSLNINRDLKWRGNFNFGYNVNEVTRLTGVPTIFDLVGADGGPLQGRPYRGLYSLVFAGLDPHSGVPTFINHDGEKSTYVDLQSPNIGYLKYEGPTDPKLTGGLYNSFTYKSFTISGLLTFAGGNKVRLNPIFSSSYSDLDATPLEFRSRWILEGDESITNIPALIDKQTYINLANDGAYPYNAYNYSSVRIAKGDFLKLKTVSVSYAFPQQWLKTIGAGSGSISAVANNFWLIYADKKLNGQDPEFFSSGGVALPIAKMYTVSLKVGF